MTRMTSTQRIAAVVATIAVVGALGTAAVAGARDYTSNHHRHTTTDVAGSHRDYGAKHGGHGARSYPQEHGNRRWYHYGEPTPHSTPGLANPEL